MGEVIIEFLVLHTYQRGLKCAAVGDLTNGGTFPGQGVLQLLTAGLFLFMSFLYMVSEVRESFSLKEKRKEKIPRLCSSPKTTVKVF